MTYKAGAISGDAPIGMPDMVAGTLPIVRDALYLAAHDTLWAAQSLYWLRDLITAFAACRQIEILRRGDWPAAFLCWAHLTADAQERFVEGGVSALRAEDIVGGKNTWLIGIAAPWRREDFDVMMSWAAQNLCEGKGGWRLLLSTNHGGHPQVMQFETVKKGKGRLVSIVL